MSDSVSTLAPSFDNFVRNNEYNSALGVLAESEAQLRNLSGLSIRDRGFAVNTHLSLCASIRDACDFATSFEKSFANREALLDSKRSSTNAAHYVVSTFSLTLRVPSNVSSSALALKKLGSSLLGRSVIGHQRGVAILLKAWRMYPNNLAVVEAIAVLCNGHVDNVSRFVREDGIDFCIQILRSGSTNSSMREQVMLLLGVCCVCLPDEGKGGKLVEVVVSTLSEATRERTLSSRDTAAHALGCLANIGEAVVRDHYMTRESHLESLPGYDITEPQKVIDVTLDAWEAWPNSWKVVSPAAWALVALYGAKQFPQEVWQKSCKRMTKLWVLTKVESSSVRALKDIVQASSPTENNAQKETEHYLTPKRSRRIAKRRRGSMLDASPVTPQFSSRTVGHAGDIQSEDTCFDDVPLTEKRYLSRRRLV